MVLDCVICVCTFFFFKQKTAYEMRISDWSSDVCSSDLLDPVNQERLEMLVRRERERGATILFSTHVMAHAERLCDRIAIIARSARRFEGTVDQEIGRASRGERVCQYV